MVGEAAVTDLADSGGRGDLFLVGEITVALVTVVSVDAIATFAVVVFAILMGTSSISASMGSDIRIITSTTTHIPIHTPISNYGAYQRVRQFWKPPERLNRGRGPFSAIRIMPAKGFNGISLGL
jgi:hypothetical protein